MKSFQKIMWDRPVVGFKVDKEDIEYWNNGMMYGVKDEAGNIVGKISNTTMRKGRIIHWDCSLPNICVMVLILPMLVN